MSIDPVTIVFALVALFVAWRLYSVLGARTGAERPPMQAPGAPRPNGPIIDMKPAPPPSERWKGVAEPGGPLAAGLDAVAAADPSFDAQHFLAGARAAYEMIINAFAAGNLDALRGLLAPEPLANFSGAIEARRAAGRTLSVTLVSLDKADVVAASTRNGTAQIVVKFAAKMTSVTHDASGAVVDGSPTRVDNHIDVWTFARPLGARNPNWLLAATEEAPH